MNDVQRSWDIIHNVKRKKSVLQQSYQSVLSKSPVTPPNATSISLMVSRLHVQLLCDGPLSLPLKVSARAHQSHALVHDNLADPKVVVDPFADVCRFRQLF